ncbi:endolytic transglycosylase MltG [Nonomuraea sp. FMUSA5-5]|uniref:Endolytic murein transglycosylase n=1 Tax=Nonomuraea composti TaxID=2720023 RepID=A0ABX1B5G5_9ACTN|nr:endolytic transglycosylase MltG [Nonomuraea sp. FMUSA5-5]
MPFRTSSSEDRSTQERDPEGGSQEGHSPEGRSPEGHSPEGRSSEGPSREGRLPEGHSPEEGGLRGKAFGEGARQGPPEAGAPDEPGAEPGAEAEVIPLPAAHRRRAVRKVGLLTAGLLAGVLALGAGAIVVLRPYLSPDDFDGPGTGTVTVRIAPGSSAEAIGSVLADAGVVASVGSFVNVAEDRAVSDRLRPGHYRLRKGMAAGAALDLLLSPAARIVRRVTVPEGLRVTEVFDRLAKQAGLTLQALKSVDQALVGLPEYAKGLEGFLFPATYEIEPGDTAVDVLAAMAERFAAAARQVGLEEQAPRLNLTPLQVVTLASMIQAEGGTDEDYPKISRVIYNRLAKDMPLEIDSTVLYAQNRRTLRVTERDTKVNSPYNTYRHKGLPPGPIANPGEKALMAALNPAEGDWQWFVTTDPRHRITKFTSKESEFVRYREELNKNLGAS